MDRVSRGSGQYAHRRNSDETFDSICKECYLTVARAYRESDLLHLEFRHVCQPVERRRTTRIVHQVYDPAAGLPEAG
ncbi:MAG TPA: hypothetical protein VKB58_05480 [Terriglobales bacterium]|nr:hypothetical protein [Terriglobales bacterium]